MIQSDPLQVERWQYSTVTAYHNQADKVYPVPEWVWVLYEVHHIRPTLQGDDEEYRHPGQPDVVEADGPMERVGGADGAGGVVLVPVNTPSTPSFSQQGLLHCLSADLSSLLTPGNLTARVGEEFLSMEKFGVEFRPCVNFCS